MSDQVQVVEVKGGRVEFNHEAGNLAEALGIPEERWQKAAVAMDAAVGSADCPSEAKANILTQEELTLAEKIFALATLWKVRPWIR